MKLLSKGGQINRPVFQAKTAMERMLSFNRYYGSMDHIEISITLSTYYDLANINASVANGRPYFAQDIFKV